MVRFISGEFFLDRRPNGGTVILLRTLWITTLIYFVALLGREALLPDRGWDFDWNRARSLLADSIPVYGAIFATTYALLYTRFSSQWMYLAQQYNQMMATGARMDRSHPDSLDCLHRWQAAFVEDADALHLAARCLRAQFLRCYREPRSENISLKRRLAEKERRVRSRRD